MESQHRRSTAALVATLACIAASTSSAVQAQSRMSRAEATQLYTAAGFAIANGQPRNRCGGPAKPRVTFVDINADKRPEALFIDENAECYAPSGRYFAVLANEGGRWRAVISGTGSVKAQASRSTGWLDMQVSDGSCVRDFRYAGHDYATATVCPGQTLAAAPSPSAAPPAAAAAPAPATVGSPASTKLSPADEAAAFKAAGFAKRGNTWRNCDDPTPTYSAGQVDQVIDLNGDGLPEALIVEGGSYCYGNTGQAYWLVSKTTDGRWKLVTNNTGIAQFLKTKGSGVWPDISVGGPGFCFPVERWNGSAYKQQRWEYEGKPCKPPR